MTQSEQFALSLSEAKNIQDEMVEIIKEKWDEAASYGTLTKNESNILEQATVLSPACFY